MNPAPSRSAITRVAALFEEYVPSARLILEAETCIAPAERIGLQTRGLEISPMATFCYKLHMDQRVQEDDQFPLVPESVDRASTRSLLIPWKEGRITPSHLSNLIQDAPTEIRRRQLEMMAVLEERESIVRWIRLPNDRAGELIRALERFQLPLISDVAGNRYFGQWDFDRKMSGPILERSTVLWAAEVLMYK